MGVNYFRNLTVWALALFALALVAFGYDVSQGEAWVVFRVLEGYYILAFVGLTAYALVGNDGENTWVRKGKALQVVFALAALLIGYFIGNPLFDAGLGSFKNTNIVSSVVELFFVASLMTMVFGGFIASLVFSLDGLRVCLWTREDDLLYLYVEDEEYAFNTETMYR